MFFKTPKSFHSEEFFMFRSHQKTGRILKAKEYYHRKGRNALAKPKIRVRQGKDDGMEKTVSVLLESQPQYLTPIFLV